MKIPLGSVYRLAALLIIGGGFLLLITLGLVPSILRLWPLLPGLLGVLLLVKASGGTGKVGPNYKLSAPGLFFICFGILFLLDSIFSPLLSISVTWPLLLISAGISLLVMAQAFRLSRRISLFIPGWYLILLGGIFFLFSAEIIQEDFIAIVRKWWPMIFVLSGVALLIADHIPSHKISGGSGVEPEELTDSDEGGLD